MEFRKNGCGSDKALTAQLFLLQVYA